MNKSDLPRGITTPWGSQAGSAYIRTVPMNGNSSDSSASYPQGFPPATFMPQAGGGASVSGQDVNGVLSDLSAWARWAKAGASVSFDAAFSSAIGGYPAGCVLQSTATPTLFWLNLADGNASDPDSGSAANWSIASGSTGTNANGRWEKRLGGVIEQSGVYAGPLSEGSYPFTFPVPFLNSCENIMATAINANGNQNRDIWAEAQSWSTSGATVFLNYVNTGGLNQCDGFFWRALGT